jgi:hypothetical protein
LIENSTLVHFAETGPMHESAFRGKADLIVGFRRRYTNSADNAVTLLILELEDVFAFGPQPTCADVRSESVMRGKADVNPILRSVESAW